MRRPPPPAVTAERKDEGGGCALLGRAPRDALLRDQEDGAGDRAHPGDARSTAGADALPGAGTEGRGSSIETVYLRCAVMRHELRTLGTVNLSRTLSCQAPTFDVLVLLMLLNAIHFDARVEWVQSKSQSGAPLRRSCGSSNVRPS